MALSKEERKSGEQNPYEGVTRAALETLPERYQQVLMLSANGLNYEQIGQQMRIEQAEVVTLVHEARKACRDALEQNLGKPLREIAEESNGHLADAHSERTSSVWRLFRMNREKKNHEQNHK